MSNKDTLRDILDELRSQYHDHELPEAVAWFNLSSALEPLGNDARKVARIIFNGWIAEHGLIDAVYAEQPG